MRLQRMMRLTIGLAIMALGPVSLLTGIPH